MLKNHWDVLYQLFTKISCFHSNLRLQQETDPERTQNFRFTRGALFDHFSLERRAVQLSTEFLSFSRKVVCVLSGKIQQMHIPAINSVAKRGIHLYQVENLRLWRSQERPPVPAAQSALREHTRALQVSEERYHFPNAKQWSELVSWRIFFLYYSAVLIGETILNMKKVPFQIMLYYRNTKIIKKIINVRTPPPRTINNLNWFH